MEACLSRPPLFCQTESLFHFRGFSVEALLRPPTGIGYFCGRAVSFCGIPLMPQKEKWF
jgi:hypothetical protein